MQSIPKPSFEVYESLDREIDPSKQSDRNSADDIFGVDGVSGLPESLTALEWTQQMAESGYWLENDQWADFQAIALASYRPELRFWLGRDRWSAFGSLAIGSKSSGDETGETNTPINHGVGATYATAGGYGGNYTDSPGTGEGQKGKNRAVAAISIYDLLLSMVKKVSKQPWFYLAILGGAVILLLAFKRQSLAKISAP